MEIAYPALYGWPNIYQEEEMYPKILVISEIQGIIFFFPLFE